MSNCVGLVFTVVFHFCVYASCWPSRAIVPIAKMVRLAAMPPFRGDGRQTKTVSNRTRAEQARGEQNPASTKTNPKHTRSNNKK